MGLWRLLSVPKMMIAGGLVGSCLYGFIDHRLGREERAAMTMPAEKPN
jgi:hypothetical protein